MNAMTSIKKADLSQLEWTVVEMARRDGPRSINPDGFLVKLTRDLFGLPVTNRLANKGLEALRRFAVRAWYWDLIRARDVRPLADAGYSSTDVQRVLAYVAASRGFTPSIEECAA